MLQVHGKLASILANKENCTVEELKKQIYQSVIYYIGKRYRINPIETYFYRVRLNKDNTGKVIEYFYHTDNLWSPPSKDAIKGRCNDKNESILYCSNHPITCIAEVKNINEGDIITLITFKVVDFIQPASFIGVDTLIKNDNLLQDLLANYYNDIKTSTETEIIKSVDHIMTNEFRLNISEKEDFKYNSTIAWRQLCFELSKANVLVYPSASSLLKTSNWAFNPEHAKQSLRPCEVHRLRICKNINNIDFEVEVDSKAVLHSYGKINWNKFTAKREFITHRKISDNPFLIGNLI